MLRVATSKTFRSIVSFVLLSGLAGAAPLPPLPEPDAQTVWPGSPRDRVGFEFDAQQFLWDDLKTSLTEAVIGGEVNVLTPDDSGIFVGGEFTTTSEVAANNIAHWDGANWAALGSGLNGPVHTIALMNDDVYVGGDFTEAGGQAANYVAKWDGASWSPLGGGLSGKITKIVVMKGSLYAVGWLSAEYPLYGIAKWDNNQWTYFHGDVELHSGSLVTDGENLFVSGTITPQKVGLVKWDGESWTELNLPSYYYYSPINLTEDRGTVTGILALLPNEFRLQIVSWKNGIWEGGTSTEGVSSFFAMEEGGLLLTSIYSPIQPPPPAETSFGPGTYAYQAGIGTPYPTPVMHLPTGRGRPSITATSRNTLFVAGYFNYSVDSFFGVYQPRVNVSRAEASTGQRVDLGPDAFGFFKPEVHCDTVTVDSGSPGIVEIHRAAPVEVAGVRANGAFRVSHPGVELPGAVLKVEFSELDVAGYPGTSLADFRPYHVKYGMDYPKTTETLKGTMLAGSSPQFERIENGVAIYSIQFKHTGISGATYAALPVGALIEDVTQVEEGLRNKLDTVVLDQDPQVGWTTLPPADPRLGGAEFDPATGSLKAYVYAARNRERIAGVISNHDQWMRFSNIEPNSIIRGHFHLWSGGQIDPENHYLVPNFALRLQTRFVQATTLEVFTHLNADPEGSRYGRDIRPSRDPQNPSVYRVDFDPVNINYGFMGGSTGEGIQMMMQAMSTDPQDHGFIALTETVLGTYPAALLGLDREPDAALRVEEGTLGASAIASQTAFLYAPSRLPGAPGRKFRAGSSIKITPNEKGITIDTRSVPANFIGVAGIELSTGDNSSRVRIEEGKQVHVRFHVTSSRFNTEQAQVRIWARSAKYQWNQKFEMGGAVTNSFEARAIMRQILPGVGCMNPEVRPGYRLPPPPWYGNGGWYSVILTSPLEAAIRPEFAEGTPISARMPALAAEPGAGSTRRSARDVNVGMDLIDSLMSYGLNGDAEKGYVTLDAVELRTFDRPLDDRDVPNQPR